MAPLADDDEDEVPEDYAPAIVAESTMSLQDHVGGLAVIELDTKDSPVFVFRNAGNDQVNIVYRRPRRQHRLDRPVDRQSRPRD